MSVDHLKYKGMHVLVCSCAGLLLLTLAVAPAHAADEDVGMNFQEVEQAVHRALEDWSRFTSTDDLDAIGGSFAQGGPQWSQLRSEVGGDDSGTKASQLVARRLRVRSVGESSATVWAEVQASRPGFQSETVAWDFDLIHQRETWLVWAVVPAGEPTGPVEVASLTTESTTTSVRAPRISDVDSDYDSQPTAAEPVAEQGLRIPALSAWVIVVTLVGVAVAGYMAPRIDRRGDR